MTKPLDPKDHRRGVVMLCHGVAGMAFQPGDLRNPQGLYLKDADFEADRGQGGPDGVRGEAGAEVAVILQ